MQTDGAKRLQRFLEDNNITQVAAAADLGVAGPTVHEWCKGTKRPRAHHREAIATWTNGLVSVASWLRRNERAAMKVVRPFTPRARGEASAPPAAESGDLPAPASKPSATGTEG